MAVLDRILNLPLRQEGATGISASQESSVKVVEDLDQGGRTTAKPVKRFLGWLVRGSVCFCGGCSDRACTG